LVLALEERVFDCDLIDALNSDEVGHRVPRCGRIARQTLHTFHVAEFAVLLPVLEFCISLLRVPVNFLIIFLFQPVGGQKVVR
jgi:hypothetical protein